MINQRFHATPRLREVLADRERSSRWLARKVGVSTSLMSFALRGERTLGLDVVIKAAVTLGEPVESLFVSTDSNVVATEVTAA